MGNMSFHQFFEISMGFEVAPFNTILFLYCYARKWLFNIYKQNLQGTSKFSNTLRLIDYLCSFSNEEFEDNCNDIYPDYWGLKKETKCPCETFVIENV